MDPIPTDGRLWLPPDCETGRKLLLKLVDFHEQNARATYRGKRHVERHLKRKTQAQAVLDSLEL